MAAPAFQPSGMVGSDVSQEPAESEERKAKRRRIAYACDLCRAKKNRCDGEQPTCGPCKDRGAQCVYSPHKSRASVTQEYVDNLKARNEYLEQQLSVTAEGNQGSAPSPYPVENGFVAPKPVVSRQPSVQATYESNYAPPLPTPAASATGHSNHHGSIDHSSNGDADAAQQAAQSLHELGRRTSTVDTHSTEYFGESSTFDFMTKVCSPRTENSKGQPALVRSAPRVATTPTSAPSLATASPSAPIFAGLLPGPGADDPLSLPSRWLADKMVNAYFSYRHPLSTYLHEGTFRRRYGRLWLSEDVGGEEPTESNLPWLGLVNLIFTFGSDFVQVPGRHSSERSRFFNRAKALVFSGLLQPGSIELVQALLLMGQYLHSSLELNSCWTVIGLANRMAQGLGLHLPAASFTSDIVEQEIRKRVWWGCFIIDRVLAVKVGRPPTVRDGPGIKAGLPLPIDDEYLSVEGVPRQPLGVPSKLDYLNQVISQCRLTERILDTFYSAGSLHEATYNPKQRSNTSSDTSKLLAASVQMDGELVAWEQSLPSHLRFDSDVSSWHFERQRSVLNMRFLNSRLIIHRQILLIYITRRVTDFFQREIIYCCVRRCIMAAYDTINSMRNLHARKMTNSFWHNSHYIFTAIGVLMVFQTLDASKQNEVDLPLGVDIDQIVIKGMEFLEDVGNGMHSLAAKYVQSLQQLLARLRGLSAATNKQSRAQTAEYQSGQTPGKNEYADNAYQADGGNAPAAVGSGEYEPSIETNSAMTFDHNITDIENLLYSPGWTGIIDDWNFSGT